jgi:hypothetical protein
MLTPGEHVLTTQDVDAMGGHGNVYAFREALHQPPPSPLGGMAQTPISGSPAGVTRIGGLPPPTGQGGGFGITGGGLFGLAESAVSSAAASAIAAAGAQFGGEVLGLQDGGPVGGGGLGPAGNPAGGLSGSVLSAAINIAIQEMNRAISYAGQVAGIGMSGLMETFLPTGGSELANQNWATRIIGGIVGARPALPNIAGNKQQGSQLTAQQLTSLQAPPVRGEHYGSGAAAGPTNNTGVHIENYNVTNTEDRAGQDLARHQVAANDPIGYR